MISDYRNFVVSWDLLYVLLYSISYLYKEWDKTIGLLLFNPFSAKLHFNFSQKEQTNCSMSVFINIRKILNIDTDVYVIEVSNDIYTDIHIYSNDIYTDIHIYAIVQKGLIYIYIITLITIPPSLLQTKST